MPITGSAKDSSTRNLKRLFILRSLTISVELLALLIARFPLNIPLPLLPLLLIIGALALANLWTWHRIGYAGNIPESEFFLQLTFDVLALTGVLYLTGGATNPFAWFFLIPLIIAATVLSSKATWLMAGITTACYSWLMFRHEPLAAVEHMRHDQSFSQHIFGMWFGFVLSAALIAWFVVGMANTLRERDRSLARAREQALRDEQLVALGTLATGAAHELGTPLATMAVVTGELERKGDLSESAQHKLKILRSQLNRCKEALAIITASAGEIPAGGGSVVSAREFVEQTARIWQQQRTGARLEISIADSSIEAKILSDRTLQQSLINLLDNAADASPDNLSLNAAWDDRFLQIDILDHGPGIHAETIRRLGQQTTSTKEHGMGLGLYLAYSTVQRLGGDIDLLNRDTGGTCTRVRLPLIADLLE